MGLAVGATLRLTKTVRPYQVGSGLPTSCRGAATKHVALQVAAALGEPCTGMWLDLGQAGKVDSEGA